MCVGGGGGGGCVLVVVVVVVDVCWLWCAEVTLGLALTLSELHGRG